MSYTASKEQFSNNFIQAGKVRHQPGMRFRIFPFVGTRREAVKDFSKVIGRYLSDLSSLEPIGIDPYVLVDQVVHETDIPFQLEDTFRNIIMQLFFDEDHNLRPINLKILSHIKADTADEERVAEYLVAVLGKRQNLQRFLSDAYRKLDEQSHALERCFCDQLKDTPKDAVAQSSYFQVITSLQKRFESDFEYILKNKDRTQEYLVQLLEFYYFIYTAHVCLQLDRLTSGERAVTDLYFCLDWENTSQNRKCYRYGWKRLQPSIDHAFVHAITLAILNQIEEHEIQYDYIALQTAAGNSPEVDIEISKQVLILTNIYRDAITDCQEMTNLVYEDSTEGHTAAAIRYLYQNVLTQFDRTDRGNVCKRYAKQFKDFALQNFLKRRGRSGEMLNLTEEQILFLTKLCVKDNDHMRLNTVFDEFEIRGVYLDLPSKRKVAEFYEKLNLIEKKSDSGDAMYVKRIL